MNLYTCEICHESNAAARLTCKACGTMPAKYTIYKVDGRYRDNPDDPWGITWIQTVAARGCLRLENTRTARVYLRTVPLDYYAN